MGIQVDPKNVIGRDELIASVWAMLRCPPEQGSLRFLAERRVGKTTIITKMASEPADGFDVVFLEVEGIDSCDHFTELLFNRLRPLFTVTGKARAILDHFATTEVPQSIDDVWSMIRGQFALTDRNLIVQMLKSLGQDHYLISDTEKRYAFRFPLVKRWWKIAQGLQS